MENQQKFSYYLYQKRTEATGNGDLYIFKPDRTIYESHVGSMNYTTGRLKVKFSGFYQINFAFNYGNVCWRHHSGFAQIKTTKRQYSFGDCNPYKICSVMGGNLGVFSGSALVDVDEGDEIWILCVVNGQHRYLGKAPKQVFIEGVHTGEDPNTFLNGFYVGPKK